MGSPRKNGDTATLLKSFLSEIEIKGAEVKTICLYDKKIAPCVECFQCQDRSGEYGCSIKDDMYDIGRRNIEGGLLHFSKSDIYLVLYRAYEGNA